MHIAIIDDSRAEQNLIVKAVTQRLTMRSTPLSGTTMMKL